MFFFLIIIFSLFGKYADICHSTKQSTKALYLYLHNNSSLEPWIYFIIFLGKLGKQISDKVRSKNNHQSSTCQGHLLSMTPFSSSHQNEQDSADHGKVIK